MTQGKAKFGPIIEGINKKILLEALKIKNSDLLENYKIQNLKYFNSS